MKKVDYEKKLGEYKDLLKEIHQALNQVKNTKIDTKNFTSTYDICSSIGKILNKV